MSNLTERVGVHHCGEIAAKKNWLFREQPISDIGIDAQESRKDFLRYK